MSDWAPHIYGFGIIAVAIAVLRLFPDSWPAVELRRSYGVRASGPDGSFRRRDFFRGAGICLALVVALVLVALGFGVLAESYPTMSRANWAASAYAFGAVLLAGVALLSALILVWNGLRWHAPTLPKQDVDEPAV